MRLPHGSLAQVLASLEGGISSADEQPAGLSHAAFRVLKPVVLTFGSGTRALIMSSVGDNGGGLLDAVEMWLLARADVMVATHGSSFASVPRAHNLKAGRGAGLVVTRDGSCLPWGNRGAPMSWAGAGWQGAGCWRERDHRTLSWGATPPPWERPPRGRMAVR